MADIFVQCPRTGTHVATGLKSEWVLLASLPRIAMPLRCPACGQMHKWSPEEAWIGPRLQANPIRINNSPATCFVAADVDGDAGPERD